MEFREEDAITLAEVSKLILEIKKDTEKFRAQCLEGIIMPEMEIEEPHSVTLSYVDGKYVVGIKPYCSFTLDENGNVQLYKQYANELDSKIANQFLEKNYDFLSSVLVHLNSLPPTYYVGFSDKIGYMSLKIEEDGTSLFITNGSIELHYPAQKTSIQYNVLNGNIKSFVLGTEFNLEKDADSYQEIVSKLLDNKISKEILPAVIKTKLGMNLEQQEPGKPLTHRS